MSIPSMIVFPQPIEAGAHIVEPDIAALGYYPGFSLNVQMLNTQYFLNESSPSSPSSHLSYGQSIASPYYYIEEPMTMFTAPLVSLPLPTYAIGPKGADVIFQHYGTKVATTEDDAGVAFYVWGLEPVVDCMAYWEYHIVGSGTNTVGGFGVGSAFTEVDSEPGRNDNPGAMLYVESGQWQVCVNGTCTNVAGSGIPTYIGIGIIVLDTTVLSVSFYPNGIDLGSSYVFEFDGPLWIPTVYLKVPNYVIELVTT